MHGLLLIDKPIGLSSAAVVAKVKRHFGFKKVGHGGTLDPFASGLLVLLIGDGTKIARFLLEGDKTYEAEADLRFETDTGDNTGRPITESALAPVEDSFLATLAQFSGEIMQRPPMYSAIKRDGKPLYAYARAGQTVEVARRPVTIRELTLLGFTNKKLRFRVRCSGGTYIRVLAQDWARAAGTQGHLSMLRRTETHGFSVTQALSLDSLLSSQERPPLISLSTALATLPRISCDPPLSQMLRNGQSRALPHLEARWPPNAPYALAMESGESKRLIAILSREIGATIPSIERVFDQDTR